MPKVAVKCPKCKNDNIKRSRLMFRHPFHDKITEDFKSPFIECININCPKCEYNWVEKINKNDL